MNVIPFPRRIELSLSDGFIVTDGVRVHGGFAATWLADQVARFTGIQLRVTDDPAVGAIRFAIGDVAADAVPTSGVRADDAVPGGEAHSITIASDGVTVTGIADEALFRGAATLLQLIVRYAEDGRAGLPAASVTDAPRFAWRGLSLDVVRQFHPAATVRQVIDLLALYKMNVLHLHLTDHEGWRIDIPGWPELVAQNGTTAYGGRRGDWYRPEAYAGLLEYARERFVTVVPEFDTPGHTASLIRAYPELASDELRALPYELQYLHPENDAVWAVVRDVLQEMARLHPDSAYLHIGGDEALRMTDEEFRAYIAKLLPLARETGKKIVAWSEATRAGLAEGDVMQLWQSPHAIEREQLVLKLMASGEIRREDFDPVTLGYVENTAKNGEDLPRGLAQGCMILLSEANYLYFDNKHREESADPAQKARHDRLGMPVSNYENGTLRGMYAWDPATVHPEIPADRIAGVEAASWGERLESDDDLFFNILPRLASAAEKGWSDPRTWDDYQLRLAFQHRFWDAMGLEWFVSSDVWAERPKRWRHSGRTA